MHMMILALYMPMVADAGGNTGSQSATVVVRALALKEISPRDALKVGFKELKVSALLALVLGGLSWAKVMFLSRGDAIPMGISLAKTGTAIALALGLQVITRNPGGSVPSAWSRENEMGPGRGGQPRTDHRGGHHGPADLFHLGQVDFGGVVERGR